MFDFHVMTGPDIRAIITESRPALIERVRQTYLAHHRGETVNPSSHWLRFPDDPTARIIALPALLPGETPVAGIKWISSFPANVSRNVPRASAVLILNDAETGYPFACLEAAQISAARTAASAALAAERLQGGREADKIAVVGAGVISRNVLEFLHAADWRIGHIAVYDTVPTYADNAAALAGRLGYGASSAPSLRAAAAGADLVVLATTAATPYLGADILAPGQNVLNLSLRDIDPDVIAASHNILDDIDHCLTANTSPHLAEQQLGHRDFIDGTIGQVLLDQIQLGGDKPRIFSPFGLGVLDIAVGIELFQAGRRLGHLRTVPEFFAETERW
ncbi:2,3-diaminopropionate biosynthesis protein SbnB [Micromonospora sp. NPDC048930]|uniref:2,3-diaminopropionate biosynthesis protein SbnB n=1 Tax=Micromonospora sp. NPDC048930 TaxID=3364261 RepID=UPI0037162BE0